MRHSTYTLRIEQEENAPALSTEDRELLQRGLSHAEDVVNGHLPEGFYCKIDEVREEGGMTVYRGSDYWVGNLAMTVAIASREQAPRDVLVPALKEFLRERPAGDPLGDKIRAELKGKP